MTERPSIGMLNGGWSVWFRIVLAIFPILIAANLAFTGWLAKELYDHSSRLSRIEGNRFTSQDGVNLWKELSSNFHSDPPPWLVARLDRIDEKLSSHLRMHTN